MRYATYCAAITITTVIALYAYSKRITHNYHTRIGH